MPKIYITQLALSFVRIQSHSKHLYHLPAYVLDAFSLSRAQVNLPEELSRFNLPYMFKIEH